jgi:hypothetical protein
VGGDELRRPRSEANDEVWLALMVEAAHHHHGLTTITASFRKRVSITFPTVLSASPRYSVSTRSAAIRYFTL